MARDFSRLLFFSPLQVQTLDGQANLLPQPLSPSDFFPATLWLIPHPPPTKDPPSPHPTQAAPPLPEPLPLVGIPPPIGLGLFPAKLRRRQDGKKPPPRVGSPLRLRQLTAVVAANPNSPAHRFPLAESIAPKSHPLLSPSPTSPKSTLTTPQSHPAPLPLPPPESPSQTPPLKHPSPHEPHSDAPLAPP